MNIKPEKYLVQMAGVKEVILPLMYFNNSVTVDASTANTVKTVLNAMKALPWVSVAIICIGTIELVVAFCWLVTKKRNEKRRRKERSKINGESQPLLAAAK